MTRDEAMAVLAKAFAALNDAQRANLRDAAAKERRICCRERSMRYRDPESGAG